MSNVSGGITAKGNPLDNQIRQYLNTHFVEPVPLPRMVDDMAIRARGIEAGHEAEKRLADKSSRIYEDEVALLAARVVVGNILKNRPVPKGATPENMAIALCHEQTFREQTRIPRDRLLEDLRNGKLVLRTVEAAQKKIKEKEALGKDLDEPKIEMRKTLPTPDEPQIKMPGL